MSADIARHKTLVAAPSGPPRKLLWADLAPHGGGSHGTFAWAGCARSRGQLSTAGDKPLRQLLAESVDSADLASFLIRLFICLARLCPGVTVKPRKHRADFA
jgi:hypothetical protein